MLDERSAAAALVAQTQELHSMPGVACRLLQLTRDPEYDLAEVIHWVERDPALAAKILRTVNSAQFGLRRVGSLHQAIAMLGQRSLRLLTMTFGLIESLTQGAPSQVVAEFWRCALGTGVVARRLAGGDPSVDQGDAYSAGLLADIGQLLLAQWDPDGYSDLYRRHRHGEELIAAERRQYGCGHPAVGAALLERWGGPATLVEAIAEHHAIPASLEGLDRIVQASGMVVDVLSTAGSPNVLSIQSLLARAMCPTVDQFIDFCRDCQREIAQELLGNGIHPTDGVDCRELVFEAQRQLRQIALEAALDLDSLDDLAADCFAPPRGN